MIRLRRYPQVQIHVVAKGLDFDFFPIQNYFYFGQYTGHIIGSLFEQTHNIRLKLGHTESFEVWVEGDLNKVFLVVVLDGRHLL